MAPLTWLSVLKLPNHLSFNTLAYQDLVYSEQEADDFYSRVVSTINIENGKIRDSKKLILDNIISSIGESLHKSTVLEIGCFIGDLLSELKRGFNCEVVGIEPSSLACKFAEDNFGLEIINKIFSHTSYFGCSLDRHQTFDLIVLDDVLSWMPRETILSSLASLDWLLKPGGHIYIRDFCPSMNFAYENHHQAGKNVFNYKVSGGHKKFFLNTGMYYVIDEHTRITSGFQKAKTFRPDSMIWSDVVMVKSNQPLQPKLNM